MFNCEVASVCEGAVPPGVSPVVQVIETRPTAYTFMSEDEEGETFMATSHGSEIVREIKVCPACAGHKVVADPKPDYSAFRVAANANLKHARSCKSLISECGTCKRIIAAFASYPPQALSAAITEPNLHNGRLSLAALAVENLIERSHHGTKRAKADFESGFAILKSYERGGGGL